MFCFAKLCRICLREDKPLVNIYCVNEDNVRLCEILTAVKPDMNTMNHALPPWICITCKKQLRRAYKFQKKCTKSLQILMHYLSLLKCDNDDNGTPKILSVQIDSTLPHNDEDDTESVPIKSEDSNSCDIFSRKTDNRCDSASFSDFNSDFINDVKNEFKFEEVSDAESESTVILNLNNVVSRVDELNNKEDNLTNELEQNVLSNLQSEQSNSVNSVNSELSSNNSNVLTNNSSDNSSDMFWSEFTKKVANCDSAKSVIELDCRSNIHFNTVSFNNQNNSESSVNIKSENNVPNTDPIEEATKNPNTQLTTENQSFTSAEIKIENEEIRTLPKEDQLDPKTSSDNSIEEQKFTFELDFTQDDTFNLNTESSELNTEPSDIKTENITIDNVDGIDTNILDNIEEITIEKTELLPIQKEDIVPEIINTDAHVQVSNSENNTNCLNYENVQDMLTIEKTELPPLKPEEQTAFSTELPLNSSNINNFKHIRVKTTEKINNTIVSQPSIDSSTHSQSVLINQHPNVNVDLNNSHLTSKNILKFSISNLVNASTNLQEQNKRLVNHTSDTPALKRRKMDGSGNGNIISNYNQGHVVLANTEMSNSTYNSSLYGSSAEYIDMDEYMRNGSNAAQNFIQTPAVFQNHALNNSYSKQTTSLNMNGTNYFVGNTNIVQSLEMNHNSYTNLQSTVSNPTLNWATSSSASNNYSGRFNYQIPTARNDIFYNRNVLNPQHNLTHPTLHQNISHTGVPNNVLHQNVSPHTTVPNNVLHQNISSHTTVPNNILQTTHSEKQFPINYLEKNVSNVGQNMPEGNKNFNTANPLQITTTVVPEIPKEYTNEEQYSDQKESMDLDIDSRPDSRNSLVSVSSSNASSNSTDPTPENNHFFSFFSNLKEASTFLRTSVQGFVENADDKLLFSVDVSKSVYTCEKCDQHFPCISELCIHGQIHTEEFDYQTMIYRTRDHTAQSETIDFVITDDIKLFLCRKCDMDFLDKPKLLSHVKRHVPNMVVTDANPLVCKCQNCTAFNVQSDGTDFKCSKCEKTFPNAENLRIHGFVHLLDSAKCVTCNRIYKSKKHLRKHNYSVHAKKLECPVCKKQVPSHIFQYHQRTHGPPKLDCDVCGKKYATSTKLRNHKLTHGDKKPFACKHCDKKFLHKAVCENHERTHTGEKPYECAECKKCFSQQTSLQVHMRVHTGEKPYKCKDCGKCYTQSYVYKQHLKKHHPPSSS